jgi:hypothetical protein
MTAKLGGWDLAVFGDDDLWLTVVAQAVGGLP